MIHKRLDQGPDDLSELITAFTSPIPTKILTDYDNKTKISHQHEGDKEP